MSSAAVQPAGGGAIPTLSPVLLRSHRDPDSDRGTDHYGPGAGGKKRKVPAFPQASGPSEVDDSPSDPAKSNSSQTTFPTNYRLARSDAAKACSFKKAMFLRRKAALITLYLDAQAVSTNGTIKGAVPKVPDFEQLLPALEDLGLGDWEPDKPGWRNGWTESRGNKIQVSESWRMGFQKRREKNEGRKAIVRGGWAPEGSFEFEMSSKASTAARERTRDRIALHKLAVELRGLVISSAKVPLVLPAPPVSTSEEKSPSKTKRRIDKKDDTAMQPNSSTLNIPKPEPPSTAMSKTLSKDGSENATGKKKPKKKKRSVLANQSNPHHVDNYRVSRTVSPQGDPLEPYPHHASLLFPPPMRLLSARPQRRIAPLAGSIPQAQPVRAQEDDFICCFCEIQLFYGSEQSRRQAIRRLKAEQKRKEQIKTKAKSVAEGKGTLKDDGDYDDEEEEWCGEGDGHGRCTCGRSLNAPHRTGKTRLKPPETDPPDGARITEVHDD